VALVGEGVTAGVGSARPVAIVAIIQNLETYLARHQRDPAAANPNQLPILAGHRLIEEFFNLLCGKAPMHRTSPGLRLSFAACSWVRCWFDNSASPTSPQAWPPLSFGPCLAYRSAPRQRRCDDLRRPYREPKL
jgi:hypothetical protein